MRSRPRAWLLTLALVEGLVGCGGGDGAAALSDGSVVVYERTLITNIGQTESMAATDLARDGDDVVVLIRYGYVTFTDHPDVGGTGPSTGGSTTSGGFLFAISRDAGRTFTLRDPIVADASVRGEPFGVHLHDGRAWLLVRRGGTGTAIPLFVHALDLDTGLVSASTPGQEFSLLVSNASSVSFVGDRMTLNVSSKDETGTQGTFGFQELDLTTGAFTDGTTSFGYQGCATTLYTHDDGASWRGYRDCGTSGPELCRFDATRSEGVPIQTCVPRADWPGPFEPPTLAITHAGPVAVYARDGESFAARIEGGRAIELPLGAGEVSDSGGWVRPSAVLRLAFGPLIAIGNGPERLVSIAADWRAYDVPLPSPCEDAEACPLAPVRVLSLGGDEVLALYQGALGADRFAQTLVLRRDTVVPVPLDVDTGPSPFPGCARAIPASPLVEACAIAATCFPNLDLRNCIREWDTAAAGPTPAAFDAFVASRDCASMRTTYPRMATASLPTCTPGCSGTNAVKSCFSIFGTQHDVIDCAARGMPCGDSPDRGIGCYDATPSTCGTCDAQGRAVACPSGGHEVSDCAAFGQVCSTDHGPARCIDPACTDALACDGAHLVSCLAVQDCSATGLTCGNPLGLSSPSCTDGVPDDACPAQGCSGQYMLVELGYERAVVDCAALTFETCTELAPGFPRCM